MQVTIDDTTRKALEEIKFRAQLARPTWVMERAISHIGRQPGLATGDAIHIMNRSIVNVLRERRKS